MPKPAGNNPCAVDAAAIDRKDVFLPGEICSWAAETEARECRREAPGAEVSRGHSREPNHVPMTSRVACSRA